MEMKFRPQLFFFIVFFVFGKSLLAQKQIETRNLHHNTLFHKIEKDFHKGSLSVDQKILYQFYTLYNSQKLPAKYQLKDALPIKCGTPAHIAFHQNRDRLSPATIREIESMQDTEIQASETYTSSSGRFVIHYETTGEHAVPSQQYVEKVAEAADSSYRHMVQNLGYTDPLPPGQPYDIEIENLRNFNGGSYYGETYRISGTTRIRVENDFSEDFPSNDDPEGHQIGAMKVTIAHELKHAIQYANSDWYGFPRDPESPHSINWSEMDATLMEEVVYDNVNDYYNYIELSNSIFQSPQESIPGAYWHVSWFIFFHESFGPQFWVDVWSRIKERYDSEQNVGGQNYLGMFAAIEKTAQESYNKTMRKVFATSFLWHLASGRSFSASDYGFEERLNYPNPRFAATINGTQDSLNSARYIDPLAANYFQVLPNGNERDQVLISFYTDTLSLSAGAIAYFKDGSTDTFFGMPASGTVLRTPWNWRELEKIGIVAANPVMDGSEIRLNIGVSSYHAELVTLAQNFPNPFNPSTTIEFRLLQESDVQLEVYDITGRLIQTLVDDTLPEGSFSTTFNADGLASGIYFYRLSTDKRILVNKMTLIK